MMHKLTERERRIIQQRHHALLDAIGIIAEINGIDGPVRLTDDLMAIIPAAARAVPIPLPAHSREGHAATERRQTDEILPNDPNSSGQSDRPVQSADRPTD